MSNIYKPGTSGGSIPTNVPTSFVTDSGTAVPVANVLKVLGQNPPNTSGIRFSATGNEVDATLFSPFVPVSGGFAIENLTSATPVFLNVRNEDTNANSRAFVQAETVAGSSADAYYTCGEETTNNFAFGLSHASSTFKMTYAQNSSTPSTGSLLYELDPNNFLGSFFLTGGFGARYAAETTSYTVKVWDYIIGVNNAGATNITLPATGARIGQQWRIKDTSGAAATNNITILPGTGTIDGAASKLINTNYGSIDVFFDGTNYFIV